VRIAEVVDEIGKSAAWNVPLLPVRTATDNLNLFSGAVVK
jgi:hypothetical protein